MSALVIVGRYPFDHRRLEGMVQRIANIDRQLAEIPRTYLDLYVFRHFKAKYQCVGKTQVYTSSFLRFWNILRILRQAEEVYIHSVYFYALIWLPLQFIRKRTRLILDVHGAVPEEIQHENHKNLAHMMQWVERRAFSHIDMVVCVTRRMENFYRKKYPSTTAAFLYLPIFTAQVCGPAEPQNVNLLRTKLGIPESAIIYLYSGGLQSWQNIDLTIDAVKQLLSSNDAWFIFLTSEVHALTAKIKLTFGCIPSRMVITHVKPNELRNYYAMANYGFILREDHILNRIANPTKLVEYLYFGMRPIVLTSDIGDFIDLGYEYVGIDYLDLTLIPQPRSKINHRISLKFLEDVALANISRHLAQSLDAN